MTALLVLSLAALAVSQTTCQSVTLNLQQKVPAGASKLIDSSFPSFAIQGSSFASYTGKPTLDCDEDAQKHEADYATGNASHPNTFSRNLIRSVEERTGGPLVVRVGGTNTSVLPPLDVYKSLTVSPETTPTLTQTKPCPSRRPSKAPASDKSLSSGPSSTRASATGPARAGSTTCRSPRATRPIRSTRHAPPSTTSGLRTSRR